eukprot:856593_1
MLFFVMIFWTIIIANCNDYLRSYYHGTPAPEDRCKPISDPEPPECPSTVGPPCPYCYTNEAPDYQDGDLLTFTDSERQLMSEFMNWYLDWWIDGEYNPKTDKGYDVFRGSAGRANIFLKVYMKSETKNKTLLKIADNYLDNALDLLPDFDKQFSAAYMKGHIGVWTMKAIYETIKDSSSSSSSSSSSDDSSESNKYFTKIIKTFESVNDAIMNGEEMSSVGLNVNDDCTLDSGLAGMLYNALLLNNHFEKEIIDISIIKNLIYHCMDIGIETGESLNTNYLQYYFPEFENCLMYGPGHGSSGWIKHVFNAYNMYPKELSDLFDIDSKYYIALKNTLDFYVEIQLDDGNTPTNTKDGCLKIYGDNSDARVQWCHGSPAFQNIFFESSILFQNINQTAADEYFLAGVESLEATWKRGILTKGPILCHGISGNIIMFWESAYFLQKLNEKYLANQSIWRAKQFLLWTLNWDNLYKTRMFDTDWDYSMFQGPFSMPMVYIDTIQHEWPSNQNICMPNWNICV